MKLLGRLIFLPVKLTGAAVESSFRAGRLVGALPVRLTRRTSRLLGARGTFGLSIGLLLGLAFAPGPGREFRARVRKLIARVQGLVTSSPGDTDADLAARVSFELEHAPRTWHLPQPSITADHGRVTLRGHATELAASDELARVAGAVPGVGTVENLIVVDGDPDGDTTATTSTTE